VHGH